MRQHRRGAAGTALLFLVLTAWMQGRPVLAQIPRLPVALEELLQKSGMLPKDGAPAFFQNWQALMQPPTRNDAFADVMEEARKEDRVLPLNHPFFDSEHAAVGHWHSPFYLENYGTALFVAAPFSEDRIPVLLVHGINGSPRDFAKLTTWLNRNGYQPLYFVYPSGMDLEDASRQFGQRLQEFLARHDVDRFVAIGHSMGGLVAKGLLDRLDVAGALPSWKLFISISSPFGGVDTAQYADRMPRHPPAWDDLAPNSAFLRKLQDTSLPSEVGFYLFFSARSSRRFMAALGNNDGVLTLNSMCDTPVSTAATDVFGFYEDHTSILESPLMFRRLEHVLAAELGAGAAKVSSKR